MATTEITLKMLLGDDFEEGDETAPPPNLLKHFYSDVANGAMTEYHSLRQYGKKQGQSYYAHVLDGITVIHKLRESGIIEINDLEECLLLAGFTVHDINKVLPWLYPNQNWNAKYAELATVENISTELARLGFDVFFPEWRDYINDIELLAHHHQHDAAPIKDLDRNRHDYKHDYDRLRDLGELMRGVDNLDLSHILGETHHKQEFLGRVNSVSDKRWKWVSHRLGENRGLLTNIIHNQIVEYLHERHGDDIVDLLYYPEGVAYLLRDRETFSWTADDTKTLAVRVAKAVAAKQGAEISKFIKARPPGIKVDRSAFEGGASYAEVMQVIWRLVDRKRYKEEWYAGYSARLQSDIAAAAANPATAALAQPLLDNPAPIVALEQKLFQLGELATAYRNLLEDYLKDKLKPLKHDPWTHIYILLELPETHYALYATVDGYRRGYFLARDCPLDFDAVYERLLADVTNLTQEVTETTTDNLTFDEYLSTNLEIIGASNPRDFKAQLKRYIKDEHRQCSNCSSALATEEWMSANVPTSIGVQSFSNRLVGGSPREPKRNVCPVCRSQFILEKLAWNFHGDKHGGKYTSFYYHFYPYAFFTEPQLRAFYDTLKSVQSEDNQSFLLRSDAYFELWGNYQKNLKGQAARAAKPLQAKFTAHPTKVNGLAIPNFSDAIANTPTLPLSAPGENYGQQFVFALTHAIMLAEFFDCRIIMSRTPVPLFSGDYLDENRLAFFVDGVPRNLRWLLPADEYRSLETYRDGNNTQEYERRLAMRYNERLDNEGRAAFENVAERLRLLYQLAQILKPDSEGYEETVLELATSAADDPLALFLEADRAIEKKIRQKDKGGKTGSPEGLAIQLSKRVVNLLAEIVKE